MPLYLKSDTLKIRQILSNLLSNAVKFTPNGGEISLNISYVRGLLKVRVEDNGIGIAEDRQKMIFQAFSQADNSITRKYGGTGLGLSISSVFVRLLGGELELVSEKGKGSIFSFSIPVEEGISSSLENAPTPVYKQNGRILVAEDAEENRFLIEILLKRQGFVVEFAEDGLVTIERFKVNRYDLIFMDVNMPNMGGIEATREILKIEKEKNLVHTPIVALTANALKGDRRRFLDAGMDEYLSKPLNIRSLTQVIENMLN